MAWALYTRLAERKAANYSEAERQAFRQGYYEGFAKRKRNEAAEYPNAYNAGYWEGVADNSTEKGT